MNYQLKYYLSCMEKQMITPDFQKDSFKVIQAKQQLEKFLEEAKDPYWMQQPKAAAYINGRIKELSEIINEKN